MKNKIVVLNSGGFDSICLMHMVKDMYPDSELHSLHFSYSQRNKDKEFKCSKKCAEKLGYKWQHIIIPNFSWSHSDLFTKDKFTNSETSYVELRNLVFLSYALSYAQSIKADTILLALLEGGDYYDTSCEFIEKINEIANDNGISIIAPFSFFSKNDLKVVAFKYGISENDFFSCNTPTDDGLPCNSCPDCLLVKEIMEYSNINTPYKYFLKDKDCNSDKFIELFMKSPIKELRIYTNDKCNSCCSHCYYKDTKAKGEGLTMEQYESLFRQAKSLGIEKFHFCGKEPLYDAQVFDVIALLKEVYPEAKVSIATNGNGVILNGISLMKCGLEKLSITLDSIPSLGFVAPMRESQNVAINAIKFLKSIEDSTLPLEVFIDLDYAFENDLKTLISVIKYLQSLNVESIYIRNVINKNCANPRFIKFLGEMCTEFEEMNFSSSVTLALSKEIVIGAEIQKNEVLTSIISDVYESGCYNSGNFSIIPEFYCNRFENSVTISYDGNILGCGMEGNNVVLSAGNIKNIPLEKAIMKGKTIQALNCFFSSSLACTMCSM